MTTTPVTSSPLSVSPSTQAPVASAQPDDRGDDWLAGATACAIENGEDCEACQ